MKKIYILLIEFLSTIIGAAVIGFAISNLLLPNELSTGGFSGIATVIYYLFKIPMGYTIVFLNIPLFVLSIFKIGKKFFVKSIIGTVTLSVIIDLLDKLQPLTSDKLLASIYGGILAGIGTAIIFKNHSSTGGTDLITNLIKVYNPMFKMGSAITIIDGIIVLLNVIFLRNIEIGLYSAIAIYLMGKVIDILFEGINFTKLIFIISDKNEIIAKEIQDNIGRGVTGLYGEGMFTKENKLVLMCAAKRNDISNIKQIVKEFDENAFIIVTNSREVLGMGFEKYS